jgi:hypothetical protein
MTTLRTIVQGRRVEVDAPADWPDGAEVEIHPVAEGSNGAGAPMSPEEIARTLAAMEQIPPFELSEAERMAWEAEHQARKERDKAQFAERADKLRRAWE